MPDLADFFRWQWLWRSRRRLFVIGLVAFLLGAALLAYLLSTLLWGQTSRNIGRAIPLPIFLMVLGGFAMLQAALSGGGAFGDHDHDDSREGRRRAWRRRKPAPPDDRPIPLAPDTAEVAASKATRCPTCHERMTVPPDVTAECPKCHERFRPG